MGEKVPVKPILPNAPVPRIMLPAAGFPPALVGYRNRLITKTGSLQAPAKPPKAWVAILPEFCKGCELCIYACPSGNLVLSEQLNRNGYHPVVFSYEGTRGPCSACGICYWVCPDFAISEIRRLRQ